MHDVDFLPPEYRQNFARAKWYGRRLLLVTLVVTLVAVTAWNQQGRLRRLQADVADLEPARVAAVETKETLNALQNRLQVNRASAELITYLRHPWPLTQILAALLHPLPKEITFEELRIGREALAGPRSGLIRSPANRKPEEKQTAGLPPAVRDLKRLREECDPRETVVSLAGTTTESAALHQYLGELGRKDLFSKSQLHSLEVDQADPEKIHFTASLVVEPGYGQPGGRTNDQ